MFSLIVNGKPREVDVAPDTPLLWVLRDTLGLTGAKFGCGEALCGSCTVHLNGAPVRACKTPLSVAAGQKVTTIEGVSGKAAQALLQAWVELDVSQCGYCQPGQIMSAAALLARNPRPSDADIDAALDGNLCRCATYQRIRAAVHHAAAKMRG